MKLDVTFTKDYLGRPLAVLRGGPFNGTELSPSQAIALANTLQLVARRANEQPPYVRLLNEQYQVGDSEPELSFLNQPTQA